MLEPPELGPLLREKRQQHGWTLDELASASGVSRSMLSQVERGEANPTFATLWSLTQALGLSIDDLVAAETDTTSARIDVLERSATPRLQGNGVGATLWLLAPPEHVGAVEWYELHIDPGGRLSSMPHATGTSEHLTVIDGRVTVQADDVVVDVPNGGTARYAADRSHEISNPGAEPARVLLVVLGSDPS